MFMLQLQLHINFLHHVHNFTQNQAYHRLYLGLYMPKHPSHTHTLTLVPIRPLVHTAGQPSQKSRKQHTKW